MSRTNVGGVEIDIHGDSSHFDREMRGTARTAERTNRVIRKEFDKTGRSATAVSKKIKGVSTSFLALGAAAGLGLTQGINVLADFGQAMSTVQAVTGATGAQLAAMTAEARRLGGTTRFSATQAAEGMIFLARAGYTADEALQSVEGTLKLAQAGGLDLGRAADIASNVLGGFNLDVSHTSRVVGVLAQAANSANVTVESLGEALKYAAPTSAALGLSLEETVAMLGKLGDSGLAGGLGGRGFSSFATAFVSKADDIRAVIGDFDLAEEGLTRLIQRLVEAGISTDQVLNIFRAENLKLFTILANGSQDAVKGIDALHNKLLDMDGVIDRVAATMDDNLNGAILSTVSAMQELVLALGAAGANEALITSFAGLKSLFVAAAENADILAVAAVALSTRAMLPLVVSTVPRVIGSLVALGGQLDLIAYKSGRVSAATTLMGSGMKAIGGPATLAIAGAAAAYLYYARSTLSAADAQDKFNQSAKRLLDVRKEIEADTQQLQAANVNLTAAIEAQGYAAEATARREIDAIQLRIIKNKELEEVYALQIRADLEAARTGAQGERSKLLGGGVLGGGSLGLKATFDFTGVEISAAELDEAVNDFLAKVKSKQANNVALTKNDRAILDRIISYREYADTVKGLEAQLREIDGGDNLGRDFRDLLDPSKGAEQKTGSTGGSSQKTTEQIQLNLELLSALERQVALDIARAQENDELVRILEQGEEIIARTADYEAAGLSTLEAKKRAQAEVTALVQAEADARDRTQLNDDFDALMDRLNSKDENRYSAPSENDRSQFKDAFGRALEDAIRGGDTEQAIRDVFATAASDGLRSAIGDLTDALFDLFSNLFSSQSGGGGGGWLSAIASGIGALFGGQAGTPGITGVIGSVAPVVAPVSAGSSVSKMGVSKGFTIHNEINIAGDASENTVRLIDEKLAANNRMLPDAIDAQVQDQLGRGGY